MKICKRCNASKSLDDFRVGKNRCRLCEREENLARYHTSGTTKESHRKATHKHGLKKYGLTPETFAELWDSQYGLCKICGIPITKHGEDAPRNKLAMVDHCHTTGKVRGLLCLECNTGLGKFKDDIELMRTAIEYLEVNREGS